MSVCVADHSSDVQDGEKQASRNQRLLNLSLLWHWYSKFLCVLRGAVQSEWPQQQVRNADIFTKCRELPLPFLFFFSVIV